MYTIIYFSPTGNVLHLANLLSDHLGETNTKLLPLEFTKIDQLTNNKHLILLYPVHGFNAPRTVKRFVRDLPDKLYDDVSMIGVGSTTGWINRSVSSDLRKAFINKGYSIMLDSILAMPLTIVMDLPFETASKLIAESEKKIKEMSKDIVEGRKSIVEADYKAQLINFVGKAEQIAGRLFGLELHANSNCNSCGICWKNCPENNIKRKNSRPQFGINCLMCM